MDISTNYVSSVQNKSKHLKDQKPKDVKGWTDNQKGLTVTPK